MNAIFAFAGKEWQDHLRNGWILAISIAFAIFALVISVAGFGFTGTLSAAGTEGALVSLTSLVLYLIPLMGLLLGYSGIVGEREQGTFDLLASYPVDALHILLGKLLGLGAVLGSALVLGLAAPAALAMAEGGGLFPWLELLGLSLFLGAVFTSLGLWLSTLGRERSTVLGLALSLWLLLVILFDLGMIGLLVATGGDLPVGWVQALFYLNPASLFRMLAFLVLLGEAGSSELGISVQAMPPWSLFAALAAWFALPVGLGAWRLRRME